LGAFKLIKEFALDSSNLKSKLDMQQINKKFFALNFKQDRTFQNYENMFVSYLCVMLDLYYLTRLLKTHSDIIPPVLSVSMFGYYHSKSIEYFLTKIVKAYDIKYNVVNIKEGKKCLQFNQPIDLNYMVAKWCKNYDVKL
jgi:hypothetical protein